MQRKSVLSLPMAMPPQAWIHHQATMQQQAAHMMEVQRRRAAFLLLLAHDSEPVSAENGEGAADR